MPNTLNLQEAEIGFALGAGASNPTYALPLYSGLPIPRQTVATTDPAGPLLVAQATRKSEIGWGASVAMPALPLSVGLLAKAMLWSESASSGTHTITPGTTQQYLTVFSRRPGALYEKWTSGSLESLTLSARVGDPNLEVAAEIIGLASSVGSAYTAGATEAMSSRLTAIGGTVAADWGAGSATRSNVSAFSVRLSRPTIVHPDYESPSAIRIDHEALRIEVALSLIFEDYAAYRAAFYGGESGTSLSSTVAEGSALFDFEETLSLSIPRVAWSMDAPEASGDGGPVIATLSGIGLRPPSGAPVTVVVVNSRSTAY